MIKNITIGLLSIGVLILAYVAILSEPNEKDKQDESPKRVVMEQVGVPETLIPLEDSSDVLENWSEYVSKESDLSFFHPSNIDCKTSRVHIKHPKWYQTNCQDFYIDTPYVDSGHGEFLPAVFFEDTVVVINGEEVIKRWYAIDVEKLYPVYIYGKSEESESFSFKFISESTENYTSVKEAELFAEALIATLLK